jgi:hypothetical protein
MPPYALTSRTKTRSGFLPAAGWVTYKCAFSSAVAPQKSFAAFYFSSPSHLVARQVKPHAPVSSQKKFTPLPCGHSVIYITPDAYINTCVHKKARQGKGKNKENLKSELKCFCAVHNKGFYLICKYFYRNVLF